MKTSLAAANTAMSIEKPGEMKALDGFPALDNTL